MENQTNQNHNNWIRLVSTMNLFLLCTLVYTLAIPRIPIVILIFLTGVTTLMFLMIIKRHSEKGKNAFIISFGIITALALAPAIFIVSVWNDVQFSNQPTIEKRYTENQQVLVDKALALSCWGYTGESCFSPTLLADVQSSIEEESVMQRIRIFFKLESASTSSTYVSVEAFPGTYDYISSRLDWKFDATDPERYFSPTGEISLSECKSLITPKSTQVVVQKSTISSSLEEFERVVIFNEAGETACQIFTPPSYSIF